MNDNLRIYEAVREVPKEAQKTINAGRLKGMTDINPMWRLKALTEQFGVCGIGWKYEIKRMWLEQTISTDEITANVEISLYIKVDGAWSEGIPGIGGSKLVSQEKAGLYVNDECYKMALTDAISVACKALGMGADIYWQSDNTKYNDGKKENSTLNPPSAFKKTLDTEITEQEQKMLKDRCEQLGVKFGDICKQAGWSAGMKFTVEHHGKALIILKEIEESRE